MTFLLNPFSIYAQHACIGERDEVATEGWSIMDWRVVPIRGGSVRNTRETI